MCCDLHFYNCDLSIIVILLIVLKKLQLLQKLIIWSSLSSFPFFYFYLRIGTNVDELSSCRRQGWGGRAGADIDVVHCKKPTRIAAK